MRKLITYTTLFLSMMVLGIPIPSLSQPVFDALQTYQNNIPSNVNNSSSSTSSSTTSTTVVSKSSQPLNCQKQRSLPLKILNSLILEKNGKFEFSYDSVNNKLNVKNSSAMIGNCNDMLEFQVVQVEDSISQESSYEFQVVFKDCDQNSCKYNYSSTNINGEMDNKSDSFSPDLKGFEQCLQKAGVVSSNKIVPDKIRKYFYSEDFSLGDKVKSGKFYYVSEGPYNDPFTRTVKNDQCKLYESTSLDSILTQEDKDRADAKAAINDLNSDNCSNCNVQAILEMLEDDKYSEFRDQIRDILKKITESDIKKSFENINSNDFEDNDLKNVSLFADHFVKPQIQKAKEAFKSWELENDPDQKESKLKELEKILDDLENLKTNYFNDNNFLKNLLINNEFEAAKSLYHSSLQIRFFKNLAKKEQNKIVTPKIAEERIQEKLDIFTDKLIRLEEEHLYKTGQSSGKAASYKEKYHQLMNQINNRNEIYENEISMLYADLQPGGYCSKYWINTQNCIEETLIEIDFLQNQLAAANEEDMAEVEEILSQFEYYSALEKQGREYLKKEYGEEDLADLVSDELETDLTLTERPKRSNQPKRHQQPPIFTTYQNYPSQTSMNPFNPFTPSYFNTQMSPGSQNPFGLWAGANTYMNQSYQPYSTYGQSNYSLQMNPTYQGSFNPFTPSYFNTQMPSGSQNPFGLWAGTNTYMNQSYQPYSTYGQSSDSPQMNWGGLPYNYVSPPQFSFYLGP